MMMMIVRTLVALMLVMVGGSAEVSRSLSSGYSTKTKSKYFSELLADGETVELLSHGPFTISANCGTMEGDSAVRLLMTVEADSDADEWVYGFPDYLPQDYYNSCVGTTPAGTTSETCIVWATGAGKSDISGAYASLSGYYVGFGGDTTVGVNKAYLADDQNRIYHDGFTAEEVAVFPTDCAISGVITYNR